MENLNDSFFNQYTDDFTEFFEDYKVHNFWKRKDYKDIDTQINNIKTENENVKNLFEGNCNAILSEDDQKEVIEILNLQQERDLIEQKECFKLGFKEALIYFTEMNLLKK